MVSRRLTNLLCGSALALTLPMAASVAQSVNSAEGAARPAASVKTKGLEEIVVTARRRSESQQKVPVAVTVLPPRTFSSTGAFKPQNLAEAVPGLSVSAQVADRDNVTYSIRGQGYAYGTLFPAVITYFNEVPITQLSTGQFFDLSQVQVLRGPQGVLFGRVTDGGAVLVGPKHPGNEFDGYIETRLGDYNLHDFDGAVNLPIVPDKLMVRAAFDVNRRDGFTKNLYNGQDLDNVAYESYRVGITLKPIEGVENYTVVQFQNVHDNGTASVLAGVNPAAIAVNTNGLFPLFTSFGNVYGLNGIGQVLPYAPGLTPLSTGAFIASLQSQLKRQQQLGPREIDQAAQNYDRRKNLYVVNSTTWDVSDNFQLKNILGYVATSDDEASDYAGDSSQVVLTCHSSCPGGNLPFASQEQFSEEFRASGKLLDNKLNYSLGTYFDYQHPNQPFENDTINVGILQRDGVQDTQTYSRAVYGSAEYDASSLLPGLKANGGIRYTEDQVKSSEATYLQPIASPYALGELTAFLPYVLASEGVPFAIGKQLAPGIAAATLNSHIPHGKCEAFGTGGLFPATCATYGADFTAVTWTGGLSYQINPRQLVYAKVSRGYRPGGVNATAGTNSAAYAPEFDRSVEVGFKGDYDIQGIKLRTNVAAYHDNYSAIQKTVVLPGPVPTSVVANAASAVVQGVELEATIIPLAGLTIGFNYAYTDAQYDKDVAYDPRSCSPSAFTITGFCPFNRFSFTPQNQASVSAHYDIPINDRYGTVNVGGNLYYQTSTALIDTAVLTPHAIESSYAVLNLDATWRGVFGRPVDLSAFITNVTDKLYRTGSDDLTENSSVGIRSNIYAEPRMFGFGLKYRFGAGGA